MGSICHKFKGIFVLTNQHSLMAVHEIVNPNWFSVCNTKNRQGLKTCANVLHFLVVRIPQNNTTSNQQCLWQTAAKPLAPPSCSRPQTYIRLTIWICLTLSLLCKLTQGVVVKLSESEPNPIRSVICKPNTMTKYTVCLHYKTLFSSQAHGDIRCHPLGQSTSFCL